jgi:two-component system sensor histidine kinase KdpD
LRESLISPIIALLYLLLVVGGARLWGLGPAIFAAVCSFLAFNFFFIPPYYTFAVHQAADLIGLLVFLIVAMIVSQLLGQAQSGMVAALLREREATLMYELSTALAGLQHDREIARTLATRILDAFPEAQVAVDVYSTGKQIEHFAVFGEGLWEPPPQRSGGGQAGPQRERSGDRSRTGGSPPSAIDLPAPTRTPDLELPLLTARGRQGALRLWREGKPFAPSEQRLLRTFASQGALALERAQLAQAETRAEILQESDRLKSALLSSVSHELRTPLATIKAGVTSLRGGGVKPDSATGEELLAVIEEDVDLLNHLVGNLLDMSRIEAGALKPQRQWDILADIVAEVAHRLRRAAARHRLEIDVRDDLPLAPVDRAQLEQVFTNLIGNSLKYAPPGTVIRVQARADDSRSLCVQVSNQGPHVPAEHLEHIFDKFYRVAAADRVTGTGLGLSICKGIVEAHGGRIWAENLPGGFAFNFVLPLEWDGTPPPRLPQEPDTP